jgi:hypothetical protein
VQSTFDHRVLFYQQRHEILDAVFLHIRDALEAGTKVVLVMAAAQRRALDQYLRFKDFQPELLNSIGVLTQLDAAETLETLTIAGALNENRFQSTIESAFDRSSEAPTRAYGEMVDLLCKRHAYDDALELERMWNRLATNNLFSLLCGYEMSVLRGTTPTDFMRHACCEHRRIDSADTVLAQTILMKRALHEYLGAERARNCG